MYISNRRENYIVHYVCDDGKAILSRANKLFVWDTVHDIRRIREFSYENPIKRFLKFPPLVRLFRTEIFHAISLKDDTYLIFFDGKIIKCNESAILSEFHIPSCRRPLDVSYNEEDSILAWGDYIRVPQDIHIYVSYDLGRNWEKTYQFDSGRIRHIHNIVYDKFRGHYWILTGDEDSQSGIWKSYDLKQITPFLVGKQTYRSVSIIPTEEGLIIPTDTPRERNYIQFYNISTEELVNLQEINGSAFYANKIGNDYFVSTTYEPSKVNTHKYAELWHSRDGRSWEKILSVKKDWLPVRYFRYPIIKIPMYSDAYKGSFYFSPRATKGGTRTIKIEL